MAVNHALHTPFKASELDADELQTGLVEHVAYVVATASKAQSLDLTGIAVPALILGTDIFTYDETDTTTVHDGTTCLVTSDGKRFKNDGTRVNGWNGYTVNDDDLTAPPASPALDDTYLLPAAPTGDWAAYGKHVAVYTQRGWVFIAPRDGMLCYVADEDAYVRYNGTTWVPGFGAAQITDGALKAAKLEQAYGWRVESETATPPGSIPAEGTLYIVGSSATGAWSGEDGNIARSTGAAWEFITAVEGMTVFNKTLGYNVSYKSGSWQRDLSAGLVVFRGDRVTAGSAGLIGTSYVEVLDLGARAVQSANNRLYAEGIVDLTGNNGGMITIGLFFDTEVTPRQSRSFAVNTSGVERAAPFKLYYDVPDITSRDVSIKVSGSTAGTATVVRAEGNLEEVTG